MRISHRLVLFKKAEQLSEWAAAGLAVGMEPSPEVIHISDTDERWPGVADLAAKLELDPTAETEFSRQELNASKYIEIEPSWHHGYPQPESGLGRPSQTYDLSKYCNECGIGAVQKAPFLMVGEPKWGKRSILQMNWVFDEYFVKPDVYKDLLEPLGIGYRPVLKYRGKLELDTVVQIDIPHAVDLDMSDLPYETCNVCHQKKYHPRIVGFFPKVLSSLDEPVVRTAEWFGSGNRAFNNIVIANRVYQKLAAAKAKGVKFKACKD